MEKPSHGEVTYCSHALTETELRRPELRTQDVVFPILNLVQRYTYTAMIIVSKHALLYIFVMMISADLAIPLPYKFTRGT